MQNAVFNIHDVVLIMTAAMCAFFALLLITTSNAKNNKNYWLAGFLLAHALIPLNELILWGYVFKVYIREHLPQINFIAGFAYYIDAVLLYFYVKSLVYKDTSYSKISLIHTIPVISYFIFMYVGFYRLPSVTQSEWILHETFTYSPTYVSLEFACRVLRVVYCIAALKLILNYKGILQATRSSIEKVDIRWLWLLVTGFLAVMVIEMLLELSKVIGVFFGIAFQHTAFNVYEWLGLTSYYSVFFLVGTLIFTNLHHFEKLESVKENDSEILGSNVHEKLLNPELAGFIDQVIKEKKLYLQADITLDHLAEQLKIKPKDLSQIINRHFGKNFWEFVNYYRVEEAKRLLLDVDAKQKTITDIYLESGFNSKSVFNTFFKKEVGVTPSAFRLNAEKL